MTTRRTFLKQAATVGSLLSVSPLLHCQDTGATAARDLEFHIFSKHLQFLDYGEMAAAAKELGFDGVELTVRPKGHVLPEHVQRDLPKAVTAIRDAGLLSTMMVTGITEVNPESRQILESAAQLGLKSYRMGYYRYPSEGTLPDALRVFRAQCQTLAKLNGELGLLGVYQNHAGTMLGASMWEIWQLLAETDPAHIACQYDIRHAVVEGGRSWPIGLRLIQSRIGCIVAKDFKWEKQDREWKLINTPIGEGMVDFSTYFKLLKQYGIQVPVAVHYEYPLGGVNHGSREIEGMTEAEVLAAMKRDLQTLKTLWAEA